jgi:hypothetical protein
MRSSNRSPTRRKALVPAIVAISALIALVPAIWSVSKVSLLPPKIESRQLQTAGAITRVLVDFESSRIADRRETWPYFNALRVRTDLLAKLMATPPALRYVGQRAHIPAAEIAAVAPVTATVQSVLTEPGSEQRSREILLSTKPFRIEVQNRPEAPVLNIYTQAPSVAQAERLGNASVAGLRDYLRALASREGFDPDTQVQLNQLGRARGGVLNPGVNKKVAGLAYLLAFALSCSTLYALALLRKGSVTRNADSEAGLPAALASNSQRRSPPEGGGFGRSAAALAAVGPAEPLSIPWPGRGGLTGGALPLRPPTFSLRELVTDAGDWPRTTRVLPWMIAIFIAMLWLVPFDSIELKASLPMDLKFDRLVLPFIVVTWLLALLAGARDAPRLRVTWIHIAAGAFVSVACLSVIIDAGDLSQALEIETSVKKLPLLMAYLSLFVIMASTVRRTEVGAFLKLTLGLAVLCALGMIWEYRFSFNIFFDWTGKVLPDLFTIQEFGSGYDDAGRRLTHGPAAHPLVAVTMLSMALPLALVGIIQAREWRGRILYGAFACILMLGVLATQRKTAILAPVSVVLTLAYFRRRELLRMAPIGAVLLVVLVLVSPGTISPVTDQFKPDRLGANNVSDRASDYDAIRPDVLTHLAFGRGYGSYQPIGHRILDSEVLVRIVEMGAVGLIAFILLPLSVVATGRSTITSRHPDWAPPVLAGVAVAIVFLVGAALFDSMSFPQVPYIFLCFAAFVVVVVRPVEPAGDQGMTAGD